MSQVSPRGTFLKIADAVKTQIAAHSETSELPSAADLMREYGVSRGVALRVFSVLHKEGVAEPVPGGRWRVVRSGEKVDRRPLAERVADVIADDDLSVGQPFPSTTSSVIGSGCHGPQ